MFLLTLKDPIAVAYTPIRSETEKHHYTKPDIAVTPVVRALDAGYAAFNKTTIGFTLNGVVVDVMVTCEHVFVEIDAANILAFQEVQ